MNLAKKDYQVFVHGVKGEADGDVNFIQSPSEVDAEMEKRGLGKSRYMNLHLIEKFSAADNGDFGGSSSADQETMFESNSPIHFGQIAKAIENTAYSVEADTVNPNTGEVIPVIKLNGLFKDSVIENKLVDPFYVVFKNKGEYELQMTSRLIGNEWIETPSTRDWVSVFMGGADATEAKVIGALASEERRLGTKAFNVEEINDLARSANGGIVDATWIATIAQGRIKATYQPAETAPKEVVLTPVKEVAATGTEGAVTTPTTPETAPVVVP